MGSRGGEFTFVVHTERSVIILYRFLYSEGTNVMYSEIIDRTTP